MIGGNKKMMTMEQTASSPNGWREDVRRLISDEEGIGVIEIVLILVVLIGLVAVFRTEINALLGRIFGSITSLSDDIL